MDVIKKNLLSIIFGVIAILAVAALFFPIGGMYQDTQAKLTTEAARFDDTYRLLTAKRLLPVMPALGRKQDVSSQFLVDSGGVPIFPNQPVIDAANFAVQEVHDQAMKLIEAAEACNIHKPLVPGVLPEVSSSSAYDFQKAYLEQIREVKGGDTGGAIASQLNATAPPTDADIQAAAEDLKNKVYIPEIYYIQGKPANDQEVNSQWKQACTLLPMQMRDAAANKARIYLLPDALSVHPAMKGHDTLSADQVWFAQLSLWIEQDVANAIADANKNADNVRSSPVKQLVKLDIPQDQTVYVTEQSTQNGGVKSDMPATPGVDFAISPTGRVCNSLYDVVHFTLVLDVDSTKLPEVLADLERNKLMTVLQVDTSSVDSSAALDNGFVFGKAPVVRVALRCEALFLRSWVDKLMPQRISDQIHGTGGTPGGGGGEPAGRFGPGGGMGPHAPRGMEPGGIGPMRRNNP